MKNIYSLIPLNTNSARAELVQLKECKFNFYVDGLLGASADTEHLLCAVNKLFIHKGKLQDVKHFRK